jgi:XRE family aerobic/anaerobic benzoate catabolism transcriptional regulator
MSPRPKPRGHSPKDRAYLRILADKIRDARAQRGMTRNALAADSGVSLRFLAQLESGQGNPSVLVLRRIASAMGFAPDWLLSDEPMRPIDQTLPMRVLKLLSEKDLRKAGQLLTHHFGKDGAAATPTRYITLIGLRGAGKTTLGNRLARHREVPFFELDREVEREYGATIGEILQLHGQPGYRRCEREILQKVLSKNPAAVIETGGGLAADPQTLPLLLEGSLAVWVRASPDEHMQRVTDQGDLRPMARSREAMRELKDILAAREPFYRQAHLHLNTSGRTVEQSFTELIEMIEMIEQRKISVGPYKDSANAPAGDSERDQVPAIARHHQTPRASSSRVDRPLRKR